MSDSADETWTSPSPPSQSGSATAPQTLASRYRLDERLAIGGMATVWRAWDDVLAREVAVKVLHVHLAADDGFRERFRREAISAANLSHPNIVGLYDTGRDGEQTFLVMELVPGSTLKDHLADGPLGIGQVARIGAQVARALAYAHGRGLVHRDVKPANMLLARDGTVKVTDFGIAKADQSEDLTSTGTVLGTAAYVSPEQIRGEEVTGAADQYSLGVVLYEALTSEQPFQGDSPLLTAAQRLEHDATPVRAVRQDVPRALEATLERMMAREPDQRYPDLTTVTETLTEHADTELEAHLLEPRPEPAPPAPATDDAGSEPTGGRAGEPTGGRANDPTRRRGILRWTLTGLLAAVAGALLWVSPAPSSLTERLWFGDGGSDAQTVPAEEIALRTYDPQSQGDGSENDEDLSHLLDGDQETPWITEHYESAAFGGLKEGVGFTMDVGQPRNIEEVQLRAQLSGLDVQLRVAEALEPQLSDWQLVDEVVNGSGLISLQPENPNVRARYLLVWITGELPSSPYSPDRYAAEFSQVSVRAQPPSST
jgi:serine/threonine-protein kinase